MKKLTLEQMQTTALLKNGKCLSKEYINSSTHLEWECSLGHRWFSKYNDIQQGKWCRICGIERRASLTRKTIDDAKNLALSRKGKCLSTFYKNSITLLDWSCEYNHVFKKRYGSVSVGEWCPVCSKFNHLSENICREIFKKIFKAKFPTIKPHWLKNTNNNLMELDGYNEELQIAFEYQGEQHYQLKSNFWNNAVDLIKRQDSDKLKAELCKENEIKLFIIKYDIPYEQIPQEVKKQAIELKINTDLYNFEVDVNKLKFIHPNKIKEAKALAKKKNGKCLSKQYLGAKINLKWECIEGHIWEASLRTIKRGSWCRKCVDFNKQKFESIAIAKRLYEQNYSLQEIIDNLGTKHKSQITFWAKKYNWQRSKLTN